MPFFKFHDKNIYYETYGSTGKPIILLNGIMMSTKSWTPFLDTLSKDNILILVDFLDQGQSEKMTCDYSQDLQVEVLKSLFEHLNLKKASIMGISYGGEIAVKFAVKHQQFIDRLLLFNTTAKTSDLLRDIGRGWNEIGKTRNGSAYYNVTIPVIYSPEHYQKNSAWMENRRTKLVPLFSTPAFLDAMERLVNSAEGHDVSVSEIEKITVPTLVVSSTADLLVPKPDQEHLAKHIKNAQYVTIEGAGHASMYEKPLLFCALVLGFVNAKDDTYTI